MLNFVSTQGLEIKKYSCDSSNTLDKVFNNFKEENPKAQIFQLTPYFDGVTECLAITYITMCN